MKVLLRSYFRIYLVIIFAFSLFYVTMFVINRIQYLHSNLMLQENRILTSIKTSVYINDMLEIRQIKYFINYAKLIEFSYINNKKSLNRLLQENVFYDFIGIIDVNGKYKYASDFNFKPLRHNINRIETVIGNMVIYDEKNDKTYRVLSYPIFINGKLDGYIVAYISVNFSLDSANIYLVSQDSYILNSSYLFDVYMGHKNLAFMYPTAWGDIEDKDEGKFIRDNVMFIFKSMNNPDLDVDGYKVQQDKLYLISMVKLDPNDNPYKISNIKIFFKYVDFRTNIVYWIIGYIWIFITSIFLFILIVNKIKANHLNELDQMTGVYSRRKGFKTLNKLIQEYNISKGRYRIFNNFISRVLKFKKPINSLHICVVDIDDLKQVNDNLGHKYGDDLIINTIKIINKYLSNNEFIIRIGGDEFIVIFINRKDTNIDEVWRNISKDFMDKNNSKQSRYNIRVSKGMFKYKRGMDIDSCIAEADRLMYQEKRMHKVNLFLN